MTMKNLSRKLSILGALTVVALSALMAYVGMTSLDMDPQEAYGLRIFLCVTVIFSAGAFAFIFVLVAKLSYARGVGPEQNSKDHHG